MHTSLFSFIIPIIQKLPGANVCTVPILDNFYILVIAISSIVRPVERTGYGHVIINNTILAVHDASFVASSFYMWYILKVNAMLFVYSWDGIKYILKHRYKSQLYKAKAVCY